MNQSKVPIALQIFLLLTLSKLLSNEFLRDNSIMKKYYENNCEFHEIVTK